ncbi:hypothetical protein A2985_04205 [Candidatus Woesebacteria bacterium RIFCSPLOWO2_01_FULL_43_11]|nr:MAG: hypothetical protein A2985_04205 [Candidatus Woesebacteria bacterium RIFCSPLOWO2_01_FULL_43_11]
MLWDFLALLLAGAVFAAISAIISAFTPAVSDLKPITAILPAIGLASMVILPWIALVRRQRKDNREES